MEKWKSALAANWLFILILLFIVFLVFMINGITGGLWYFALIFCVAYPVILIRTIYLHFVGPASTSISEETGEVVESSSSLLDKMKPVGIAGLVFLLLFFVVLSGSEKVFALSYAVVTFCCLVFYDLILTLFRKALA